jgi:hypothetical protein
MIVSAQFRIGSYEDIYNRECFNIMSLLSDIGGAQSALLVVGGLIAGLFARQLLYAAMIENVYHTDHIGRRKFDKNRREHQKRMQSFNSISSEEK